MGRFSLWTDEEGRPQLRLADADPEAPPAPTREDVYRALAQKAQGLQMPEGMGLEGLDAAQGVDAEAASRARFAMAGERSAALIQRRQPNFAGMEPGKEALQAYLRRRAVAGEDLGRQAKAIEMEGEFEKARRQDELARAKAAQDSAHWDSEFGLKEGQAGEVGRHNRSEEALGWARLKDEKAKAAKDASDKKTEGALKAAGDLRRELQGNQVYKDTQLLASAYKKVASASENAAGDMSLIYGFMKILDPGSSVREGEFANAEQVGGAAAKFLNLYNKTIEGQRLTPAVRAQMKAEAGRLWAAQKVRFQTVADPYRSLAIKAGVSPDDVVLPLGDEEPSKTPAARIAELKASGVTDPAQIKAKLREEGY